jgi:hypothetical protein
MHLHSTIAAGNDRLGSYAVREVTAATESGSRSTAIVLER